MTKEELEVVLAGIRKLRQRVNRHELFLDRAVRIAIGVSTQMQAVDTTLVPVNCGRCIGKMFTLSQMDGDWE